MVARSVTLAHAVRVVGSPKRAYRPQSIFSTCALTAPAAPQARGTVEVPPLPALPQRNSGALTVKQAKGRLVVLDGSGTRPPAPVRKSCWVSSSDWLGLKRSIMT